MDKQLGIRGPKRFSVARAAFGSADSSLLAEIVASGADITLLLGRDGSIQDVAYRDRSLEKYGLDSWPGRGLADVVTRECVDKVGALLEEAFKDGHSRPHQINHPGNEDGDLPTDFVVVRFEGFDHLVGFGRDLRRFAKIQQQLINAQFELEREYRSIRENEARYRVVFQKLRGAVVIVDTDNLSISDANAAAAKLFLIDQSKLAGQPFPSLFAKSERGAVINALRAAADQGRPESVIVPGETGENGFSLYVDPFRESGKTHLLVGVTSILEASENGADDATPSGWIENVPEAMAIIDTAGVIVDINDRFLDLIRVLNRNQIIGRAIGTWVGASNVDMQVLTSRLSHEGEVHQFLTTVRDAVGISRNVRVSASHPKQGKQLANLIFYEFPVHEARVKVSGAGSGAESADFAELVGRVPLKTLVREAGDVIEKLCIESALHQTSNNKASAADLLGVSRQSLYMKLKQHGLD